MNPMVRRAATILAASALGVLAFAAPASAHVTIAPVEAEAGSYARLDFRVPNESDEASTIEVEVNLPKETPLASVRTKKIDGWKVETKTRKLDKPIDLHGRKVKEAIGTIIWTADSDKTGIQPGEFGEFPITAGPLPDKGTLVFKTIQTYSDKSKSEWIDEPNEDGSEPEEPAPTLKITPAKGGGHHGGTTTGDDDDADDADDHADDEDEAAGSGTTILAAVGTGLAAIALVVAVLAFLARQRGSAAKP
ncbi:YcnI family protein [Stackebrandtia nassauensis]|nr:YcnI family protein [Stackebrandtia nassauensis]